MSAGCVIRRHHACFSNRPRQWVHSNRELDVDLQRKIYDKKCILASWWPIIQM